MSAFQAAADRVRHGADPTTEARALVDQMTLDEQLGCLDGDLGYWPGIIEMMQGYGSRPWPAAHVERLGVPGLDFADGPRGCVIGPSTAFPVSMARGASFDPELEERIGAAIGAELRAQGATFTGAVCMNLLRHPAWGRAQETYGEDPHHVGELAAAFTRGLQRHVMACMKHFALNSMENARFKVDITADERALHEVYLPHFRRVADEGVASVMSAYNSLNGEWCGQNHTLLTEILRDEWGWEGFVITDFILGLRDPATSVAAGLNIEMPFAQQRAVALPEAIEAGDVDPADVAARVTETVATFLRFADVYDHAPPATVVGCDEHRQLARTAAVDSTVLLRNNGILPADPAAVSRVAVLGSLADQVNLGDAGSSDVADAPNPVTPLAGLRAAFSDADVVASADDAAIAADADLVVVVVGYTKEHEGEYVGGGMNDEMAKIMPPIDHPVVGLADPADAAKLGQLSAGGDGRYEGGDRSSLRLLPEDEALIDAARRVNANVVVVVIAGSAVVMPWLDEVPAALVAWYGGVEGGSAIADVITGAEPGGRLPFAIPFDESDLVHFDKEASAETYTLLHGQWHLDATDTAAHRPFGHGMSYTTFEIGEAERHADVVRAAITNTGPRAGSTVVQVYGSVTDSAHERPRRRLVGFDKVHLEPGESARTEIALDFEQLRIRSGGTWLVEDARITLGIGFDAATTTEVSS